MLFIEHFLSENWILKPREQACEKERQSKKLIIAFAGMWWDKSQSKCVFVSFFPPLFIKSISNVVKLKVYLFYGRVYCTDCTLYVFVHWPGCVLIWFGCRFECEIGYLGFVCLSFWCCGLWWRYETFELVNFYATLSHSKCSGLSKQRTLYEWLDGTSKSEVPFCTAVRLWPYIVMIFNICMPSCQEWWWIFISWWLCALPHIKAT